MGRCEESLQERETQLSELRSRLEATEAAAAEHLRLLLRIEELQERRQNAAAALRGDAPLRSGVS